MTQLHRHTPYLTCNDLEERNREIPPFDSTLKLALQLIKTTHGYADVGQEIENLLARGRIRFDARLPDRAQTGVLGIITIGPEAIASSHLSLAQTLVHERFHLHQNPFGKTVSFWAGVLTFSPPMRRFERPAYEAALAFLKAVLRDHPHLRREAIAEQAAIKEVFLRDYGLHL